MFEFKERRCARGRSHDWTECPYAHPGEKAHQRDLGSFTILRGGAEPIDSVPDVVRKEAVFYEILI